MEDQLRYLEGGLAVLDDYLLSNEMFWPVGVQSSRGQSSLPTLSMGGILLARLVLQASVLSEGNRLRFEHLDQQLLAIRSRWRVAWGNKCRKSFGVRLRLWRDFLNELREQPEEHADRYAYEVRWRVMLHLLKAEAPAIDEAELQLLTTLDAILRQLLVGEAFIWDQDLKAGFPFPEYWFLYGRVLGEIH